MRAPLLLAEAVALRILPVFAIRATVRSETCRRSAQSRNVCPRIRAHTASVSFEGGLNMLFYDPLDFSDHRG